MVLLYRTETSFILDVADEDPADPPKFADARPARAAWAYSWPRTFALDLGWYVDDDVKHVWALVPIPVTHDGGVPDAPDIPPRAGPQPRS